MKKCLALMLVFAFLLSFASAYSDVTDHPLLESIERADESGIVTGYPDDTFRPDILVSRAEFVTMINRALGIAGCAVSPFTDVHPTDWYAPEIEKALSVGYINGKSATSFAPGETVTRGETAVILSRISAVQTEPDCGYADFSDTLPDWLKPGMYYAWDSGVFDDFVNREGDFLPNEPMTRAECASVITAFLDTQERMPAYLTICDESDTKLDPDGDNLLYLNLFGKDLFANLCGTSEKLTYLDPTKAAEAYNQLKDIAEIRFKTANLDVTGVYLLEIDPNLAYICLTVLPTAEGTGELVMEAVLKGDSHATANGFSKCRRNYPDRVTRIASAENLVCTETDGSYTVTWDKDDRITAYSVIAASADGSRMAVFAGDIVIIGNTLTADVTDLIKSLELTEGTILVIGYTNTIGTETRPCSTSFGLSE